MTINERAQGEITILQPKGRLDATSAPETEKRLTALIADGARSIIFDLSDMEYVSSAGLRVFLSSAKRMKQVQGKLTLARPAAQIRQILDMAGFSAILPIFDTLPEAINSYSTTGTPLPGPANVTSGTLSFAEEFYLLALDDCKGVINLLPSSMLDYALAAALLMELALCDRIDTDLTTMKMISSTPTGNPLLDNALRDLHQNVGPHTTSFWLEQLAKRDGCIGERVLASLIRKGILKQENKRILWVFEVRRYPLIDDREIKEVRTRLRELILGDDIPDPRDVVLISLGNTCRLLDHLFTPEEFGRVQARIDALARLDLIGRATANAIHEIERDMAIIAMPMM